MIYICMRVCVRVWVRTYARRHINLRGVIFFFFFPLFFKCRIIKVDFLVNDCEKKENQRIFEGENGKQETRTTRNRICFYFLSPFHRFSFITDRITKKVIFFKGASEKKGEGEKGKRKAMRFLQ